MNIYTEEKQNGNSFTCTRNHFNRNRGGAIFGIIGIIMGIQGKKIPEQAGMAQAGFVCSIVGTILCLLTYIACIACISCVAVLL